MGGLGKANHVAEIDVATHKVNRTVLVGKRAWGLGMNADGSRLYVANGLSDDLSIVDTAAGKALENRARRPCAPQRAGEVMQNHFYF